MVFQVRRSEGVAESVLGGDLGALGLSGHELVLKCSPKPHNPVKACRRERVFV